jgi:hypothetical protein
VTLPSARSIGCRAAIALATWLAGAAACGGAPAAGPAPAAASPAPPDARSEIQRRRDAACDALGPRITACAVEDTRADLAAGKIDQRQFERDTAPPVLRKHTEKFVEACKGSSYSSRQVRVLEVCPREESRCAPLLDCLGHLSDAPPAGADRK